MRKTIKLTLLFVVCALLYVACSDENLTLKESAKGLSASENPVKTLSADSAAVPAIRIVSFNFDSLHVTGTVRTPQSTQVVGLISLVVPDSTSLTAIVPTITVGADATGLSPASGVPQNFSSSKLYQVFGPPPLFKRNYTVVVSFQHDFLITSVLNFSLHAGEGFAVSGNFSLNSNEYSVNFKNLHTGQITTTSNIKSNTGQSVTIKVPAGLQVGRYSVSIKRTTPEKVIEKVVPGDITIF